MQSQAARYIFCRIRVHVIFYRSNFNPITFASATLTTPASERSVGGLDYGTVRAAAFMGLRMLSGAAARLAAQGSLCAPAKGRAPAEELEDPPPLGEHAHAG